MTIQAPTHADIEKSAPDFQPSSLLEARARAWEAIEKFRRQIEPGMKESEATRLLSSTLKDEGMGKFWHRTIVRFGANTLLSFRQHSQEDFALGTDDIYFLDIGPVWNGYEADAGKTFAIGSNEDMHRIAADAEAIFGELKTLWASEGISGAKLYDEGAKRARVRGWALNLDEKGHRIADFPHAVYHKGSLLDVGFTPSPYAWILEVKLLDPAGRFGAFFEDVIF